MNPTYKLTAKQYNPVKKATFPTYRGRTVRLELATTVTLSDVNWGGGSKNTYKFLRADDSGRVRLGALATYAPWDRRNPEGQRVELDARTVVVEHSYFCGRDLGLRIYMHPELAKQLGWVPELEAPKGN